MARYKHTDAEAGQGMFLPVNLKEQLLPGSFEYMLDRLIGGKIDASAFDTNYKNDETGAAAIPPAALIKLIIYGYSKGRMSPGAVGLGEEQHNSESAGLRHGTALDDDSGFYSSQRRKVQRSVCKSIGILRGAGSDRRADFCHRRVAAAAGRVAGCNRDGGRIRETAENIPADGGEAHREAYMPIEYK